MPVRSRWVTRTVPTALLAVTAAGCFGGPGNVFSLDVGDCFDDPDTDSAEITDVEMVDCGSPHDNEVFATFDLPAIDYPGPDEVQAAGLVGCVERFEDYVGETVDASPLDATMLLPTELGWTSRDDREVICYLLDPGGAKLEGSMQGGSEP